MNLKAQMEYRADFWITGIAQIITYSSSIAVLWILVNRFGDLAGWTLPDLAFLFAFHMLGYSIGASMSFVQMRDLEEQVRLGTFDVLLTKPISTWVYHGLLAASTSATPAHVILGVAVMALGADDGGDRLVDRLGALLHCIAAQRGTGHRRDHDHDRHHGADLDAVQPPLFALLRLLGAVPLPAQDLPRRHPVGDADHRPDGLHGRGPVRRAARQADVPILGDWAGPAALLAGPLVVLVSMALWRYAMNRYQGAGG